MKSCKITPMDPFYKLKVTPKAGMVVLACYTDNSWYRARIVSVWNIRDKSKKIYFKNFFYGDLKLKAMVLRQLTTSCLYVIWCVEACYTVSCQMIFCTIKVTVTCEKSFYEYCVT